MNILQAGKLKRVARRSKVNRLLIILLIVGLVVTNIYNSIQVKNLQKQINNTKIIITEDDVEPTLEESMNIQPPKITDVRPLE